MQQLINLDSQTDQQTDRYYDECLSYIQNHLLQFYQRYADENGLSIEQVQGRVSRWDLDQWKQAINEIDTTGWPIDATKRMKAYGVTAGIDKPHMIGAIVAVGLLRMMVRYQQTVKQRAQSDGTEEVRRMAENYQLNQKETKRVTSIITQSCTREMWSNRLWLDSDDMANDVEKLVNKHLRHGMSLTDLQNMLVMHTNPKQFKPNQSIADRVKQMQNNAKRIVRTESARLVNQANITTYRMTGVLKVKLVMQPGHCARCQDIADNGPYVIGTQPDAPLHPNCRCVWEPDD